MVSSTIREWDPKTMSVITRYRRPSNVKKSKHTGIVRVVPRKKTVGSQKIERNSDCVEVTIDIIKELSHLSQTAAAVKLGLSVTALKHACRTLGFEKWPRDHDGMGGNETAQTSSGETPSDNEVAKNLNMGNAKDPSASEKSSNSCELATGIAIAAETPRIELKRQESFASLELGLIPCVDEDATESQSLSLFNPRERSSQKEITEFQDQAPCNFPIAVVEQDDEDPAGWCAHHPDAMEWEDEGSLQGFFDSEIEQTDDIFDGENCATLDDMMFRRHCFEHARLAREHNLWSLAIE